MKNVRLFAVAASLGMFASTVVAAEPKTTVSWSDAPAAIKVDMGEKIVVTAPKATVTSSEEKVVAGSYYELPETSNANGWLYTDALYFNSQADALKAMSLNGGRFLAPGTDENEGTYYCQLDGTSFTETEDLVNHLVELGLVELFKDEDGDLLYAHIWDESAYSKNGKSALTTDYLTVAPGSSRKAAEDVYDAIAEFYALGKITANSNVAVFGDNDSVVTAATGTTYMPIYVQNDEALQLDTNGNPVEFAVSFNPTTLKPKFGYDVDDDGNDDDFDAPVILVKEKKKGGYTFEGVVEGGVATVYVQGSDTGLTVSSAALSEYASKTMYAFDADFATVDYDGNHSAAQASEKAFKFSDVKWLETQTAKYYAKDASTDNTTITLYAYNDAVTHLYSTDYRKASNQEVAVTPFYGKGQYVESDGTTITVVTTAGNGLDSDETHTLYTATTTEVAIGATTYAAGFYLEKGAPSGTAMVKVSANTGLNTSKAYIKYEPAVAPASLVTTVVIDDQGRQVTTFDRTLDKIAYNTKDSEGNIDATKYLTYEDVQYYNGSKLISLTESNQASYFTLANLSAGYLYVSGKKLTTTGANSMFNATGLIELEKDEKFDFVDYVSGIGYKTVSERLSDKFTVTGAVQAYDPASDTVSVVTRETVTNENEVDYAQRLGTVGEVTIVDISDVDSATTLKGASKVGSIKPVSYVQYESTNQAVIFDLEDGTTETVKAGSQLALLLATQGETAFKTAINAYYNTGIANLAATSFTFASGQTANLAGVYYVESAENDSDKYVLYTGSKSGLTYTWNTNRSKELIYAEDVEGNTLTVNAVELEDGWYPAFASQEELEKFVVAITGLGALEGSSAKADSKSDFYAWYDNAKDLLDVDDANENATLDVFRLGDKFELPTSSKNEETKVVDSTSTEVTVTSNLADIDTTVAGVKTLTYTATYKGEVVGTKDVAVVVAPKYARTWENGKVKTLTSYYVSNPSAKYAVYEYDWAKKSATVTYYNLDGSVADTAVIAL